MHLLFLHYACSYSFKYRFHAALLVVCLLYNHLAMSNNFFWGGGGIPEPPPPPPNLVSITCYPFTLAQFSSHQICRDPPPSKGCTPSLSHAAGTKMYLSLAPEYHTTYRTVASRVGLSILCWHNFEHNRCGLA